MPDFAAKILTEIDRANRVLPVLNQQDRQNLERYIAELDGRIGHSDAEPSRD